MQINVRTLHTENIHLQWVDLLNMAVEQTECKMLMGNEPDVKGKFAKLSHNMNIVHG